MKVQSPTYSKQGDLPFRGRDKVDTPLPSNMFRSRPKEPTVDANDEKKVTDNESEPTTGIPQFSPPANYSPLSYTSLDETQSDKLASLKEYINSIALPESDPYHQKEKSFLSELTFQRYLR